MKNFVSQNVKSWNRFSDSVPRKRAGGRSFGDNSRNGLIVVKSVGVSMQAMCVALQIVAAQYANVFRVCESCMTPGTVDYAVRRLVITRHVATYKTFTHTAMPCAGF